MVSMNNYIYCELFPFYDYMTTVTDEITASFLDSDKIDDVLNEEIHVLRYVEGIIRKLRQEKEATRRAMILSKMPIK